MGSSPPLSLSLVSTSVSLSKTLVPAVFSADSSIYDKSAAQLWKTTGWKRMPKSAGDHAVVVSYDSRNSIALTLTDKSTKVFYTDMYGCLQFGVDLNRKMKVKGASLWRPCLDNSSSQVIVWWWLLCRRQPLNKGKNHKPKLHRPTTKTSGRNQ